MYFFARKTELKPCSIYNSAIVGVPTDDSKTQTNLCYTVFNEDDYAFILGSLPDRMECRLNGLSDSLIRLYAKHDVLIHTRHFSFDLPPSPPKEGRKAYSKSLLGRGRALGRLSIFV